MKQELTLAHTKTMNEIRQQIQFYFSPANLIVDQPLRQKMETNKKRWVDMNYFLSCRKVQKIFQNSPFCNSNQRQLIKIIAQSLNSSDMLKCFDGRVKHKKRLDYQKQFRKILYFETNSLNRQEIVKILQKFQANLNQIVFNTGSNWVFIYFGEMEVTQVQTLYQRVSSFCQHMDLTILNWSQVQKNHKNFDELLKKVQIKKVKSKKNKKINKKNKVKISLYLKQSRATDLQYRKNLRFRRIKQKRQRKVKGQEQMMQIEQAEN